MREKVEIELKKLGKGETISYKELASRVGSHPRAVARILATNKDKEVPCFKVVRSDGKLGGYNGLLGESKKELLDKDSN